MGLTRGRTCSGRVEVVTGDLCEAEWVGTTCIECGTDCVEREERGVEGDIVEAVAFTHRRRSSKSR